MAVTKLIAGNWKMNGLKQDGQARAEALAGMLAGGAVAAAEVVLCPPAILIAQTVAAVANSGIHVGGQDCHAAASGAHTGDISAAMLKDAGCGYVIVGHSERRQNHGETSAQVAAKAVAAHAAGLVAIVCVGETDAERVAGAAEDVVAAQIRESLPEGARAENTVLAYEPVWAIGTGKVASVEDIRAMHAHIRALTPEGMRLLYGGSVKADNAREILGIAHVDGVLVGGASLNPEDFGAIARAAG